MDKEKRITNTKRRRNFRNAVLKGPIFICITCHQIMYTHSVIKITEKHCEKLRYCNEMNYKNVTRYNKKSSDGNMYMCTRCWLSLTAGKMLAMAVAKGLC